jgi:heterodisulfide reductase subunit A
MTTEAGMTTETEPVTGNRQPATGNRQPVTARVAVVGGGPAGMAAVGALATMNIGVDWYEKEDRVGGKLNNYHQLFPDRVPVSEAYGQLVKGTHYDNIDRHLGKAITSIGVNAGRIRLNGKDNKIGEADAVILATGFDFFDARLKEEFGYGIYKHVITSADLETLFAGGDKSLNVNGSGPGSVAFVHCVGSRDEQVGVRYCSRLCCITGIKQAIEIRGEYPETRVYNFYIDMRAFGTGYEELYREAQEKHGVRFIRGRVSEASEDIQGRIRLKAEDTLMAKPIKLTVDWLVLLIGMSPSCSAVLSGNGEGEKSFANAENPFTGSAAKGQPGVFLAGCCAGPMSIPESVASGRSAAVQAAEYLNTRNGNSE